MNTSYTLRSEEDVSTLAVVAKDLTQWLHNCLKVVEQQSGTVLSEDLEVTISIGNAERLTERAKRVGAPQGILTGLNSLAFETEPTPGRYVVHVHSSGPHVSIPTVNSTLPSKPS